eukprot:scaffold216453_cov39-Attheya_sp.AAC.1
MRSRTQEPHQGIRSSGRGEGFMCVSVHAQENVSEGQWQLRLKAVVRGMVICLRYGGRWWWENGLNARMGYSG